MSTMKFVIALVAFFAFVASASAYLVNAGPYTVDVNYIVMPAAVVPITTDIYGMHIEGAVLNIFPGDGKAFIGTLSYLNGTSPDTVPAVQSAAGFAFGAMGEDLSGVTFAIDSVGRQNVVTDTSAAKVGLLGDGKTLLIVASNYEGGVDVVSYIMNTATITQTSDLNTYRAVSF